MPPTLRVEIVTRLAEVAPAAWDALAGDDDPFVEHAFLHALEASGSVGEAAGWAPVHALAYEGAALVGALPLYVKSHSYGEYIFDWGWARAAHGAGLDYYPKLVSMVPVTPATGRRFLVDAAGRADPARGHAIREALLGATMALAERLRASSVHLNYLAADEADWLERDHGLIRRLTVQFHWDNAGYRTFDDYLAAWRAKTRKECRRERRKVAESGLRIETRTGPELTEADWAALQRFYEDTCDRKGSETYLTPRFFDELRRHVAHRVVAVFAYDAAGERVAATLNFEKGRHLFGRYWGARAAHEALHFELCYYRLIERCIERGLTHFEAGAQGEHKLRRGLLPADIHSAHWLADPRLDAAVRDHVARENLATRAYMASLAAHGPFRRDGEP